MLSQQYYLNMVTYNNLFKPTIFGKNMKYAMFGDIHGTELGNLEGALSSENPDCLICTGDFDQVKSIRQYVELKDRYEAIGKTVIAVPGNHDYAILNGYQINSGAIRRQGKNSFELHEEFKNDPFTYNRLRGLVDSKHPKYTSHGIGIYLDPKRFGKDFKTRIIHGAYDGDLSSSPGCPDSIKELWARLKSSEDFIKNFRAMEEGGCNVMIRGHDHDAFYAHDICDGHPQGFITYNPWKETSGFRLLRERRHVINPGALFKNFFATIETGVPGEKSPILKYHEL